MNLGGFSRILQDDFGAKILSPGDTSREVTGLSVEEAAEGWIEGGTVAVVSRSRTESGYLKLIELAKENGCPAIIFRRYEGDSTAPVNLSANAIRESKERGVALIEVSGEVMVGRLVAMLLTEERKETELLKLSHRAGRELLSVGGGEEISLESVTARVAKMLGRAVVLEDPVGRLVPASPEGHGDSTLVSTLHENGLRASRPGSVEETRRERRDRYARLPDGFLSVPVERWRVGGKGGRELYWSPLGEGVPSGYLWIDLEDRPLAPEDVVNLYWARRVLRTELDKDRIRLETELGIRGDFVDDLISGHYGSVELLLQRARYLGANLTQGALVLIVDIDDFAKYLGRRRLKEPAIQELKRRLADAVRLQAREIFSNFLTGPRSDNVILLISPSSNPSDSESPEEIPEKARLLASRIQRYVRGLLPDLTVSVGIGRFASEPSRLPEAYSEAEVALEIGHRIHGPSAISTFETTGTYKLLFKVLRDDPQELESFYEETLRPVVVYDDRYGTELIHTLTTYLANNASTVKTAGELFAHRHTVRYRLDRITELTSLDIEKTEDRERLTLGLKAMQLLGRAPERPPTISER